MLTIAYITARREPRIQWFIDSLYNQSGGDMTNKKVVIVSPYPVEVDIPATIVKPKPSVFQGDFRLTKEEWFSAANARNTALCHAPDGHIIYADDLSVLAPGWLDRAIDATKTNKIVCGTYQKVKKLRVKGGLIESFEDFQEGRDTRLPYAFSDYYPCDGKWLYGCSCVMPVEALLTINGWPEFVDSLGSEDYCCGIALQNAGYEFVFDKKLKTLESEEDHHNQERMRKEDWHFENGKPVVGGNGSDDFSHAALNIALNSKFFPHYLGDGFENIRQLRQHALKGGEFPIRKHPEHHWWTKIPLKDL